MILNSMAPASMALNFVPCNMKHSPYIAHRSRVHMSVPFSASVAIPTGKNLHVPYQEEGVLALRATPLHRGDYGYFPCTAPLLPGREKALAFTRSPVVVAASKSFSYSYPRMTEKPKWWWRTLACVPYLVPLHEAWMFACTAYKLQPFLESFEFLADPFLDTLSLLPNWFMMVLMYVLYLAVVRRKELPHFLRFHVVMALLLSLASQTMTIVCGWMPDTIFKGRMSYFWIAVAFSQMFTMLKCMQCSLSGMYAEVPFMSESAYINLSL